MTVESSRQETPVKEPGFSNKQQNEEQEYPLLAMLFNVVYTE